MRRLFVQIGVLTGLVLMLGVAGNAQISQQYRAEIPFDFEVKNESFKAGSYTISPVDANSGSGAVAIHSKTSGKGRFLGLTQLGGTRAETGKLVFVKAGGRYMLSQVITPTFEMKIKTTRTEARLANNSSVKPETVAINLRP